MEWLKYVLAIISGLSAAIPLVIKLVNVTTNAVKEKNWNKLVEMAMGYMSEAENKFEKGSDKKQWVMAMIQVSAANIDYALNTESLQKISDMIDAMCDMAKVVNAEVSTANVVKEDTKTKKAGT